MAASGSMSADIRTRPLIVVVDDDPTILESVQWILEDEGYEVITAADGAQAVEQTMVHRPALLVLDMGLPLLSAGGGDERGRPSGRAGGADRRRGVLPQAV
jgi:CheY-like chemotaxis protein